MKVFELSKELGISNKDLISFYKNSGYSVVSHTQNINDEMIAKAKDNFEPKKEESKKAEPKKSAETKAAPVPEIEKKTYAPTDTIPCISIVPWQLAEVSLDKTVVYQWNGYGDVEYVAYRDLQAFKRKDIIKESKIIIDDEYLCSAWSRELGSTYKRFLTVEYLEEFFELSDARFEELLVNAPDSIKNVIKYTALDMIRNENYPTLQKINIIDSVLGTCIKEFL